MVSITSSRASFLMVLLSVLASVSSFSNIPTSSFISRTFSQQHNTNENQSTSLQMGFGDAFKSAFSNDDSLGKAQNAGLSGGPKNNDNVSINGKPVKAVVGQKVSVVAASARVKIDYNCKNGDCGTCTVKINGRNSKACQATIPSGKCNIVTPY